MAKHTPDQAPALLIECWVDLLQAIYQNAFEQEQTHFHTAFYRIPHILFYFHAQLQMLEFQQIFLVSLLKYTQYLLCL